jgi:hypothetical protein
MPVVSRFEYARVPVWANRDRRDESAGEDIVMKIQYDPTVDAVYIELVPGGPKSVERTVHVTDGGGEPAMNGFRADTPRPCTSPVFRVTKVRPCAFAVAASKPSTTDTVRTSDGPGPMASKARREHGLVGRPLAHAARAGRLSS